jgi:hypothetical protein
MKREIFNCSPMREERGERREVVKRLPRRTSSSSLAVIGLPTKTIIRAS